MLGIFNTLQAAIKYAGDINRAREGQGYTPVRVWHREDGLYACVCAWDEVQAYMLANGKFIGCVKLAELQHARKAYLMGKSA